ncbi:MarR family winged helix-turn-helix transcriptional regulator [Spirochaeta cellobiosiphila]|uniref:MarR family winged helix-turn-helix transcriptional regulator n=1 Tax=Spirochaeta cellobiosiphila TaxID=504483 RepID=UPI000400626B|nr:MarR family transcriptional regulator [Spirochaeta cellobiosiphila]
MGIQEEIKVRRFKSTQSKGIINVLYTANWFVSLVNQALKPMDLSEPQFNILSSLYEAKEEAMTVSELQQMMIQRSSNVTRIIDKLLSRGLVTRNVCPENRRKVDITITNEGKDIYKKSRKLVWKIQEVIENNIDESEAELLSTTLDKIRENQ